MKAILTSICGMALLIGAGVHIWSGAEAAIQDRDFYTAAAESSLAEVALSNVALQKSQNDQVKQFAQQMVTDHTQANQELAQLATSKGITIPTTLPDKRQRDVTKLNEEGTANFDREYMEQMVEDHEKAVKLFQRQSERGTDADAKAWAAKMLPALQGHLTMARTLHASLRGTRGGNSSNNNSGGSNMNSNSDHGNMNMNSNSNMNSNRGNSNMNSNMNSNSNRGNSNANTNNNSNRGNSNTNTNSNRGNNSNTGNSNNGSTGNTNNR